MWGIVLLIVLGLAFADETAWAQSASGVRGLSGGVGTLFSLTGPGNLYADSQSNQEIGRAHV